MWIWVDLDVRMPGLVRGDLESIYPMAKAEWMVGAGVPTQMVKDIIQMYILHRHGGLFTDLDMFAVTTTVPISAEGFLFSLEPSRREPGIIDKNPYPGQFWGATAP